MIDVHCQQSIGIDFEYNYVSMEHKPDVSRGLTIVDEIKDGKVDKIIGHGNELEDECIVSGVPLGTIGVNVRRAYRDQYDDVGHTIRVQFRSRPHRVIDSRT